MSKFQRFNKYHVAKVADAEKALTPLEFEFLCMLFKKVDTWRLKNNKSSLRCVCVEDDWPEYEKVWRMIEERVIAGEPITPNAN